jgi:hypothetical protein
MAGSPNRGTIPNINSPDAKVPTERDFGFNRNAPGQAVTGAVDPIGGMFAIAASLAASEAMRKRYPDAVVPGSDRNNEADAYKHATWNYLMSKTIGPDRAKIMADAHEIDGINPSAIGERIGFSKNSQGERLMDLHNNQVGRSLPPQGEQAIQDALKKATFENGHSKEVAWRSI